MLRTIKIWEQTEMLCNKKKKQKRCIIRSYNLYCTRESREEQQKHCIHYKKKKTKTKYISRSWITYLQIWPRKTTSTHPHIYRDQKFLLLRRFLLLLLSILSSNGFLLCRTLSEVLFWRDPSQVFQYSSRSSQFSHL